jgi:hypothetical protein
MKLLKINTTSITWDEVKLRPCKHCEARVENVCMNFEAPISVSTLDTCFRYCCNCPGKDTPMECPLITFNMLDVLL